MADRIKVRMAALRQEADVAIERADAAERRAKEVRTHTHARTYAQRAPSHTGANVCRERAIARSSSRF